MVVDCVQHDLFFFLQPFIDRLAQRPRAIFGLIGNLMVIILCVLIVRQTQTVNTILGLEQVNQIITVFEVDRVVADPM